MLDRARFVVPRRVCYTGPKPAEMRKCMDEFPVLETERLLLREFQPGDAPAVFDIFSRDEVTRYNNLETMHSIAPAAR